ncbi:MAG: HAD family hydrolase [Candidatus Micrarchaeia archaeon]
MQRIKAILFDLDGVIVDSKEHVVKVFQQVFTMFGFEKPPRKDIERLWASGSRNIIRELLPKEKRSEGLIRQMSLETSRISIETIGDMKIGGGVPGLLERLGKRYRLGLVTNRGRSTPAVLRHFGIKFDVVITSADCDNIKPHPEPILKALKALNVDKESAVYVGDNGVDLEAGRAAGVFTIILGDAVKGDANIRRIEEVAEVIAKIEEGKY